MSNSVDVQLEGLAAFQEGAAQLKAGDPLALRPDGARLLCVGRDGAAVGLVPADKRGPLSRGPWAGTVRSIKRQRVAAAAAAAAAAGAGEEGGAAGGDDAAAAGAAASAQAGGDEQQQQDPQPPPVPPAEQQAQQQAQQQQQAVVQLLVRFKPEEQRWAARGDAAPAPAADEMECDTARLSTEQLEALAASEEVRCMLRDERLQKVVADIDGAADRERALLRALQAPNFREFADRVLGVVAPPEPAAG